MPDKRQHPLDGIADELKDWLVSESSWYAKALIGEYHAPFAAQISESDKLAAYRRMVFQPLPDGSGVDYEKPNIQGRDALQQRVGIEQYANIMRSVMPNAGRSHVETMDADIPASDEYVGDY